MKVFVNGNWVGNCCNADDMIAPIKQLRRKHEVPKEISIVRDIQNKEIRFFTDSGRVQRPLLIVEVRICLFCLLIYCLDIEWEH